MGNSTGDAPIPGNLGLSQSAQTALNYAASIIARDHQLSNGQTALYWHLASVASKHIYRAEAGKQNQETGK